MMRPTNIECAEFLAVALADIDGEAGATDMTLVVAHLRACPPCSHEYEVQRQVKVLVQRSSGCNVAPDSLRVRIMSSIRESSHGAVHERRVDMTFEIDDGSQP